MPRAKNSTERRAQIVEGLRRAMARHGWEGATVQAIAREAELTPGLVHYHFETKQQVLLALVEQLAASLRSRWERRASGLTEPRARLRAFVDAHLELGEDADRYAVRCWVEIAAEAVHQPEVQAVWSAVVRDRLDVLTGLVREVLHAEGRQADPRPVAATLLAAIEGAFQLGVAAPDAVPPGFAAPGLHAMLDGLLGPSRQPVTARNARSTDWAVWDGEPR